MLTIPYELEQQVIQFAQIEHCEPVAFLQRIIANYQETLYLRGIEASFTEWNDSEDEENFRDL